MIRIIDYGLGNIQAFMTLLNRLGFEAMRATSDTDLLGASKIILPGVGAFDHAMELLDDSGMRPALDELVLSDKVPVLGVCVGMQILANKSEEGYSSGLGWLPGRVRLLASDDNTICLPLPHMGWNEVSPAPASPLFKNLEVGARFYFLHSYYFECARASDSAAHVHYGLEFDCAVQSDNVFGVQFHPEKSHHWGAALLKNFAEL